MLNKSKLFLVTIATILIVACSSFKAADDFNQPTSLTPIAAAEAELMQESASINGGIVTDYTLSKYYPHQVYLPVQQTKLLNTNDLLFTPVNVSTMTPIFNDIEFNQNSTTSNINQQFMTYKDPLKLAEILQMEESITPEVLQHRAQTLQMANSVIEYFLSTNPSYRSKFESAAGYAVFDITSFSALLYVGGYGRGVIFDNIQNKVVYTDYFRAGTGFGVGYIGQYFIYVFRNHAAISQFIGLGGGGDIGASGTFGVWGKYFSFNPMIDTYQIYKNGANFQGNWGGSVYWKSPGTN